MKKFFFLFAFIGLFAFAANAQKKACCAAKGASTEKVSCTTSADAERAASSDASIVKQVSNTGDVSYTRKNVCPVTGKVSYEAVEYCTKSGKFVNVSPSDKAACTKSASATKVSSSEKKACCDKGAEGGKACCKKDAGKASNTSTTTGDAKVKLVSDEGSN
ncbi:MAG: hypothetical protein H6577_02665 [Lewinellaceae bacterium]|nr:hypothetical protein [Saprospiraceae bacterium]MCB9337012.1 hypothetical protein [Lewinellaceae bacterium]